jgi:hypothetical protein
MSEIHRLFQPTSATHQAPLSTPKHCDMFGLFESLFFSHSFQYMYNISQQNLLNEKNVQYLSLKLFFLGTIPFICGKQFKLDINTVFFLYSIWDPVILTY